MRFAVDFPRSDSLAARNAARTPIVRNESKQYIYVNIIMRFKNA